MQWLLEIGLSNAVAAVVLAMVAWVVGKLTRRPAVTHALCFLVLLKLLTPPIIELPLPLPIGNLALTGNVDTSAPGDAALRETASSTDAASTRESPRSIHGTAVNEAPRQAAVRLDLPQAARPRVFAAPRDVNDATATNDAATQRSRTTPNDALESGGATPIASTPHEPRAWDSSWTTLGPILTSIWIAGIGISFLVQVVLGLRLRAVLRTSVPAPLEVRKAAERLAVRMGLGKSPPVRVVTAASSPMLCGLGPRTSIVIPAALLERLSPEARTTVFAHELAHYRRGDQWVRLVELIATGLYWWHPVVWWARHRIELAEEQCCDAHVLRECRGGARVYAEAILDVVDFLSEPAARVRPVLSSGIRQRPLLQERLRDLMQGTCVPTVPPGARRTIAIVGALGLCYHPTFFVTPAPGARAASATTLTQHEFRDRRTAVQELIVVQPSRLAPAKRIRAAGAGETPAPQGTQPPQGIARSAPRAVWATAISPNGRHQVCVRPGYECELREMVTSRVQPLAGRIVCVAFSPDSARFVTGDRDGTVRLWESDSGVELAVLDRRPGPVYSVAWCPADDSVAAAGEDGTIRVVSVDSPAARGATVRVGGPVRCVRFSPSGRHLAIAADTWQADRGGRLAIYDLRTRTFTRAWRTDVPLGAVQFSTRDSVLAADWSGQVSRWSASGRLIPEITWIAKELVSAASFSADTRALEAAADEMDGISPRRNEAEGPI